jgi:uncharacterized protein YcbX
MSVPALPATPLGFALDRRFMLVSTKIDPKTGLFTNMHVSGFESMCLFTTHIPDAESSKPVSELREIEVRYGKSHSFKDSTKEVGKESLMVPVEPEVEASGLESVKVRMHHSPTKAWDMGEKYNAWFTERFGFEVKLLYLGSNRRKVLGNVAPDVHAKQRRGELKQYDGLKNAADEDGAASGGGWLGGLTSAIKSTVSSVSGGIVGAGGSNGEDGIDQGIGFSDVAPFLIVSATSHANAAKRFENPEDIDISKFRPNIVVEGADEAFEEDFWAELMFSPKSGGDEAKIVLTQNCARCNSLNVDYKTGKVAEGETGKLLATLSKDRRVDPGSKWSPIFGKYGFLAGKGSGVDGRQVVFSVGDEVKVVKRKNSEGRTAWEWPGLGTYPKDL